MSLFTGDRDLAEDLAQEAILRACIHWPKVRLSDSRSAWLSRVAFNLAKSQFRRGDRWRKLQHRLDVPHARVADTADAADAVAIRAAVAALPERQRQALVLRCYADLPVSEVALLMECPEGTIKTLTSRAIATLRASGLIDQPLTMQETSDGN